MRIQSYFDLGTVLLQSDRLILIRVQNERFYIFFRRILSSNLSVAVEEMKDTITNKLDVPQTSIIKVMIGMFAQNT